MMAGMKRTTKQNLLRSAAVAVLALAPVWSPSTALARDAEPEKEVYDARLEGYQTNPTLPPAGSGLTWCALLGLGVLCCIGLFKDAKRSHLD